MHALGSLGARHTNEGKVGKLESGSGSESNGTYAKQC